MDQTVEARQIEKCLGKHNRKLKSQKCLRPRQGHPAFNQNFLDAIRYVLPFLFVLRSRIFLCDLWASSATLAVKTLVLVLVFIFILVLIFSVSPCLRGRCWVAAVE